MELNFGAELNSFREEVQDFLNTSLPDDLKKAGELCAGIYADQPVAVEWLRILNDKGWAVPHWPEEYGGTGWSLEQHYIFQRELTLASAPPITPNATRMVGPVIIAFGTDEQKAEYLPKIKTGEDWWAQGYSEPQSGSDLASLLCKAEIDGDDYIINGTKIWTTHAQWSNKMFCLVRTDNTGKKQEGISFLLFDMDNPGITVDPIISISGDHELNQVFFEDARVPRSGLLGEHDQGWTVAKYLLQHERGNSFAPGLQVKVAKLRDMASKETDGAGRPLSENEDFAQKLAETEFALKAQEMNELRIFSAAGQGKPVGAMSSMIKVKGTELRQRVTELAVELAHYYATPFQPDAREFRGNNDFVGPEYAVPVVPQYMNDRAATIYAGSNEVQRNIMSKAVLGL